MRADKGIDGFAALLGKAGLELGAEEMADALWLAGHISLGEREQVIEEEAVESTIREKYLNSELEDEGDAAQLPLSLPQKQDGADSGAVQPDGIPIKVPAAPALRIRLELTRALRPLRRRVPSPVRMEFDQAATIERIADQGIWSPVLSPAPERWLDVALVIEESKSTPLWKETLAEFQTLLERQGAFRSVSSWRLRSDDMGELTLLSKQSSRPRSARELLDSTGRRLILVISDCTSVAWRRGTIYPWLETWGEQASMIVIQLLPERLWAQTGLAYGTPMWLSALEPGVPSSRMMATAQMQLWDLFESEQEQVTVPVVSLEAEPLKQWARVVTGAGESRTVGFRFKKRELSPGEIEREEKQPELSAKERVRLFRATASLTAKKLAGLMSAAPVNPQIVNLIRQTMLPEAEPVHVAEVFMGGLIKTINEGEYDFIPEVRDLLSNAVSVKNLEQVLDTVSAYISRQIGLNNYSFEAFLFRDLNSIITNSKTEKVISSFANLSIDVLQKLGGDYSLIANQIVRENYTKLSELNLKENSQENLVTKDNLDSQRFGQNYYSKLSRLLAAGNWKAADLETFSVMCEVAGRGRGDILSAEDIQTFPELDLSTIDQLWTKYSGGKFGFSVQRKLWQHFHSPRNHNQDWERLTTTVGWRNAQDKQLKYQELTFDKTAPEGHLPYSVYSLKPSFDLKQFEVGNCEWFMFSGFSDRLKSLPIPVSPAVILETSTRKIPKVDKTISLKPLDVFISYARKDEGIKIELEKHLSTMVKEGKINLWQDQMIEAGMEWNSAVQAQLETAELILLLITPSFMASDYIYNHELTRAMERHRAGTARVIPIILKPIDFEGAPFSKLQALPQNAMAVSLWPDQDLAFVKVVEGIRGTIQNFV